MLDQLMAAAQQNDSAPIVVLDGARATLGGQQFGPFDLTIRTGERIAILGASGAGKSTLLKLITRELPCSAGAVHFKGLPLAAWSLADLSYNRAVLPQASAVAFGLDVALVIAIGRVVRDNDPELRHVIDAAAGLAHAAHLLPRRFNTLSGGEQARVQLARIFAQLWDRRQGLILVDEPLAALDPGLQADLLDSLDRFAQERGHTVLAILHDINHALLGFDRLLLIEDGQLCGDLASDAAAVPALERLYGIRLNSLLTDDGDVVVVPAHGRRRLRAAWRQASP